MIEIVKPGILALVQDLGRPGLAAIGVGRSGAADAPALALANRLVGNAETAAGIELTLGGLVARFHSGAWVALTGAPCRMRIGVRWAAAHSPAYVPAGTVLRVERPARGLRSYLAVRGGIDAPAVLGSRATDLLSGIGPGALRSGSRLAIGGDVDGEPTVDLAPVAAMAEQPVLRVLFGPRADWFTAAAAAALCSTHYQVAPASNRVGLRLAGPRLERAVPGELAPEGMVRGALQVPPDGQPVLFLADHPVTGGYPVIAVVIDDDLPLAAQARPGQRLSFRPARAA